MYLTIKSKKITLIILSYCVVYCNITRQEIIHIEHMWQQFQSFILQIFVDIYARMRELFHWIMEYVKLIVYVCYFIHLISRWLTHLSYDFTCASLETRADGNLETIFCRKKCATFIYFCLNGSRLVKSRYQIYQHL